jgi:hypothetical protein
MEDVSGSYTKRDKSNKVRTSKFDYPCNGFRRSPQNDSYRPSFLPQGRLQSSDAHVDPVPRVRSDSCIDISL